MCTCDDVLYLCAFTLDRHTICVAVVSRVREKEMQMATCKYSRGKFKESDILPFAFLFGRRGGPRARLFGGQLIELFYRSHKTHMRRGVLCPTDQIRLLIWCSFARYFTQPLRRCLFGGETLQL